MATCKVNTLQSLYPELVEGLQFSVGSLSDEFYAKGMIGMDTYRDIARRHEPGAAEIRLLLMEVTKNIDQKNNFESFINILQQDTSNSCLADLVIKKHKELLQEDDCHSASVPNPSLLQRDSGVCSVVAILVSAAAVALMSIAVYQYLLPHPQSSTSNHIKRTTNGANPPNSKELKETPASIPTLIVTPQASGIEVVDACLEKLKSPKFRMTNVNTFLKRIAYVMSKFGKEQLHSGGIWQVPLTAFKDTQDPDSHRKLPGKYKRIKEAYDIDWMSVTYSELDKPFYSALAARLYFSNNPEAIPHGVHEQALYWKYSLYMRGAGQGSVEIFIKKVNELEEQI